MVGCWTGTVFCDFAVVQVYCVVVFGFFGDLVVLDLVLGGFARF